MSSECLLVGKEWDPKELLGSEAPAAGRGHRWSEPVSQLLLGSEVPAPVTGHLMARA